VVVDRKTASKAKVVEKGWSVRISEYTGSTPAFGPVDIVSRTPKQVVVRRTHAWTGYRTHLDPKFVFATEKEARALVASELRKQLVMAKNAVQRLEKSIKLVESGAKNDIMGQAYEDEDYDVELEG
jgi:hypothetical protein